MNTIQRSAFDAEIAEARNLIAASDLARAFAHLERAHVIGQRSVGPHVLSHCLMLLVEWRRGRLAAIPGQLARIVLGALGSAVGVVPAGNTGGTNIGMFRRMPIEADLQNIIDGRAGDERSRLRDSPGGG